MLTTKLYIARLVVTKLGKKKYSGTHKPRVSLLSLFVSGLKQPVYMLRGYITVLANPNEILICNIPQEMTFGSRSTYPCKAFFIVNELQSVALLCL